MSVSNLIINEVRVPCLSGDFLPEKNTTTSQLFDRQAERRPNATAICMGDAELSYGELRERSNRLARFLQSRGFGSGQFVGICIDRSWEMAIGLLGIMKSGAAYVPLDPRFPPERLKFTIADAGIKCIISTTDCASAIPDCDVEIHQLDALSDRLASIERDTPEVTLSPSSPAYLIYTSGSTGKPKGVMVPHEALVNFLRSMQISPGITEGDRLLAVTTISFDISGLELYLPLISGASLRLLKDREARNSSILNHFTESGEISIMQATPTTWQMMLNGGWKGHRQLKALVGGEAFPPALAKRMLGKCGEIWNMYGPTETTIWSAHARVTDTQISLGTPIHNTRIYVMEDGEICIGGKGLALGYKDRPELNAEKFLYSQVAGERIYRTGDLGRIDEGGRLHFLGRIDHQVKVNGYRIETGEIEALIDEDDGVRQSVVTVKSYGANDSRLVAYVMPELQSTADMGETAEGPDRVALWETIWSNAHGQDSAVYDPTFNYAGYNNSFTGKPMPEEQMREWGRNTIARIRELNPKNVLEIGCGTGILLFAIAPDTDRYVGTDISTSALSHVQAQVEKNPELASKVALHHRPAHALPDLEPGTFDTIILNSVVQYFPGADYLEGVIKKLVPLLRPDGSIFIGDVRNLLLLEAFHKKLLQAVTSQEPSHQQVRQSVRKEEELVLAPEWFLALKSKIPAVRDVTIAPKEGRFENEFNCFRYDTTISIAPPVTAEVEWHHWTRENWTKTRLSEVLESGPSVLALEGVRNAMLSESRGDAAASPRLRLRDRAIAPGGCVDLGARYNYNVRTSWANSDRTGAFDVVFLQNENIVPAFGPTELDSSSQKTTNYPMLPSLARQLEPRLRKRLGEFLPDYELPKAYVFLDSFPQTLNGKVDRKNLPEPNLGRPVLANSFQKPQTDEERLLAEIWAETLQIEEVGATDNFFDLGGSSILLTQMHGKIAGHFPGTSIIDLLEHPTIRTLAESLASLGHASPSQGNDRMEKRMTRGRPVQARRNLRKSLKNQFTDDGDERA
ncbi:MAG: amino acid adenylation domain-containing protein [Hormoscilla sp.]